MLSTNKPLKNDETNTNNFIKKKEHIFIYHLVTKTTHNGKYKYLMGKRGDSDHFYIERTDYSKSIMDPVIESNTLADCFGWIKSDLNKVLENSQELKNTTDKNVQDRIRETITETIYFKFLKEQYDISLSHHSNAYKILRNLLEPLINDTDEKKYSSFHSEITYSDTSDSEDEDVNPHCFKIYDKYSGVGIAKTNHGDKRVMWSCAKKKVISDACGLCPNLQEYVKNIDLLLKYCHKERFLYEMNDLQHSNTSEIYLSILMPHFDETTKNMLKKDIGEFVNFSQGQSIQQVLPKLEYIFTYKKELSNSTKIKDKLDDLNKMCEYMNSLK